MLPSFKPRYPYGDDGIPSWNATTAWADAMITLGFIAAATERVRLGVAVVPLITTDPVTLAKQSATADLLVQRPLREDPRGRRASTTAARRPAAALDRWPR